MAEEKTNRQLMLSGTIDESSTKEIIEKIYEWNRFDTEQEEKLKKYDRPVITILIDSLGGELYSGFGVFSVIRWSKTPVHTICTSKAMSAGFIILIAGHKRFAYPYSYMLYHQLSSGSWGTHEHNKFDLEENNRLMADIIKIVTRRTNINIKQLEDYNEKSKDWLMNASEALKLGVIDEIL